MTETTAAQMSNLWRELAEFKAQAEKLDAQKTDYQRRDLSKALSKRLRDIAISLESIPSR